MSLTVFAYIFGAIILYVTIWLLYSPLKMVFKLLCNSLIGCVGLVIANFSLGWLGIGIGVNAVTCLVTGILGLPGIALLLVLGRLF